MAFRSSRPFCSPYSIAWFSLASHFRRFRRAVRQAMLPGSKEAKAKIFFWTLPALPQSFWPLLLGSASAPSPPLLGDVLTWTCSSSATLPLLGLLSSLLSLLPLLSSSSGFWSSGCT